MDRWLCKWDGSIVCVCGGGGGQHYKSSVGVEGVDLEIQIRQWGRQRNDRFIKKLPNLLAADK